MRAWHLALGLIPVLGGCGNFQLASSVTPVGVRSPEQQQLDNLTCKDKAKLEANTTGRQTGAFLLGLTIVGAPVAFEMEKAKQREVYKACMEERGYQVVPAADDARAVKPAMQTTTPTSPGIYVPPPAAPPPAIASPLPASRPPSPAPAPAPMASPARDEAAQLQKLKDLFDRGLISESEYAAKRKAILDGL